MIPANEAKQLVLKSDKGLGELMEELDDIIEEEARSGRTAIEYSLPKHISEHVVLKLRDELSYLGYQTRILKTYNDQFCIEINWGLRSV